jgi:hypothetical protein
MHKKLMMACMAIAAFAAFVIAPAAQGAALTEGGVAVATGTSLTAKSTGVTKFTGGFGVECETAHLTGTVTTNSNGTLAGKIPAANALFHNAGSNPCSSLLGATTVKVTSELCLHVPKGSDVLTITGCSGVVTFDLTAGGITCKYEASSVSGTITTNVTPAVTTVSAQKAVEEEPRVFFCPDEGQLDMTFDLYTAGGTTGLTIS